MVLAVLRRLSAAEGRLYRTEQAGREGAGPLGDHGVVVRAIGSTNSLTHMKIHFSRLVEASHAHEYQLKYAAVRD